MTMSMLFGMWTRSAEHKNLQHNFETEDDQESINVHVNGFF